MPIVQRLLNLDDLVAGLSAPPVVINDMEKLTEEDREKVSDLICQRFENTDQVSIIPKCKCGERKGEHALNEICPECGYPVTSPMPDEIEPLIWVRAPKGVVALINPEIWIMLKARFTKSGFNIIQWVCDTKYNPNVKVPPVLAKVIGSGIKRGYNHFIENFDSIMEILFEINDFKLKKNQRDFLRELLVRERKNIFSQYLPLPNRMFLIIEKTNVGVYVDDSIPKAIDAIQTMVAIDNPMMDFSQHVRENRTVKMLAKLADYYQADISTNVDSKQGMIRKNMLGARIHFSFRTVITSTTDPHNARQIIVPWCAAVGVFFIHILSKIKSKTNMTHNQALGFLYSNVYKYDPMLDEIFDELINEAGPLGVPCIVHRNPTLLPGSMQKCYIGKVHKDTRILSTAVSVLIFKSMNADRIVHHDSDVMMIPL